MNLFDLDELEDAGSIGADLCIVGSGPAGASIAMEFAGSNIRVLVLEGGELKETVTGRSLYDVENVGVPRTTPQDRVRNRIVGGSSHSWSGRCTSLDEIDFERRAWIPDSGWPITLADVQSFLDRSGKYLAIGPNIYDDRLWNKLGTAPPRPRIDPTFLKPHFWQYSRDKNNSLEPVRFSSTISKISAPNIRLLMNANVVHINTNGSGTRVKSLEVRTFHGRRTIVKTRTVVLACGGLENARLLLASNRLATRGLGNSYDLVGRYLMDHPGCTLGWFDPRRSAAIQSRFGHFLLDHERGRALYSFGLMLSPNIQREEKLLNCAAFLEQAPFADDSWNALRRLIGLSTERHGITKDLFTLVKNVPALTKNAYRRAVRRQMPILKTNELSLYCLVEQTPDPSSRVTLGELKDHLGMPRLRVDWRIGELERRSVTRLSDIIHSELNRVGLRNYFRHNLLLDDCDWRSQFTDRAHPSGTTRMSDSPKNGVVDRNCKVHEVGGLYISGSSVFPTAGHANPTLMIVALAIRLADWLKKTEFSGSSA